MTLLAVSVTLVLDVRYLDNWNKKCRDNPHRMRAPVKHMMRCYHIDIDVETTVTNMGKLTW